jgi:hypothetical protein
MMASRMSPSVRSSAKAKRYRLPTYWPRVPRKRIAWGMVPMGYGSISLSTRWLIPLVVR